MKLLLLTSFLCAVADPALSVAVLRARYAYLRETRPALPDSLPRVKAAADAGKGPALAEPIHWNGAAPLLPPEEAVANLRAIEALLRSLRSGRAEPVAPAAS